MRLILYIQGMAPPTSKLKLLRSLKGSIQVLLKLSFNVLIVQLLFDMMEMMDMMMIGILYLP